MHKHPIRPGRSVAKPLALVLAFAACTAPAAVAKKHAIAHMAGTPAAACFLNAGVPYVPSRGHLTVSAIATCNYAQEYGQADIQATRRSDGATYIWTNPTNINTYALAGNVTAWVVNANIGSGTWDVYEQARFYVGLGPMDTYGCTGSGRFWTCGKAHYVFTN